MTPNVWMFISSYKALREYLIENKSISSCVQLAKGAFFKEATVDICAFVMHNARGTIGTYVRLENFKGDMNVIYPIHMPLAGTEGCIEHKMWLQILP